MFETAYKNVIDWTFPIVSSCRHRNDRISTSLGTGFLVNQEAYFLTAAHVVASHVVNIEKITHDKDRGPKAEAIRNANLPKNEEVKQLRALGHPEADDPINTSLSIWLVIGKSEELESLTIDQYGDIAIGKILNFVPRDGQTYPTFCSFDDDKIPSGKSLCIIGHAFYKFSTYWDEDAGEFKIPAGTFPIPRFPLDGILTRGMNVEIRDQDTGTSHERRFIELSAPGLKGQSGGPVFDIDSTILGVVSRTMSHELEFNTEEKQYFHAALAVHPTSVCEFMDEHGVAYNAA